MKLTRQLVLEKWAKEWRTLKAWRRDLSDVTVEISQEKHPLRLGTCWPLEQRLTVYVGASIQEDLHTLLHEFAHAVEITDDHGEEWQGTFARAVTEVTGIRVPVAADNFRVVNSAAKDAVKSWWIASGNAFLWKMCR